MTKNEAVENLLVSVMLADGDADLSEIKVIDDFMNDLGSDEISLRNAAERITGITLEERKTLFNQSVWFLKDISMDEKMLLLEKINDIIEADGIIASGEIDILEKINSEWNFD